MGTHRAPEAAWRRLARTRWLWLTVFGLPALALLVRTRRRPRAERLLALVVGGLLTVSGLLAERVAGRVLPPPPELRGRVEPRPTAPPAGHTAVYAWGESTMHGDVFAPHLTIPKVVAWSLRGTLGGKPLTVQNLARPGASLGEGLPQGLWTVLTEPERYRPAAVLVYVGHNEFANARRDRLAPNEPEAERRWVHRRYDATLRTLAAQARKVGAAFIVALPTSNLRGHPPPGPRHAPGERVDEAAFETALAAAERREGDTGLPAARRAVALSPGHAWAHFVLAQRLVGSGREQAAGDAYERARDLDYNRQRATRAQNALIRELCDEGLARCVDASAALLRRYDALDDSCFIDLHHPVARGHGLIGVAFARALAAAVPGPADQRPPWPFPEQGWPAGLDPTAATQERYLQTAAWYLGLAHDQLRGYPRALRDSLARVERNLQPLRQALPSLPARERRALANRVDTASLLAALMANNTQAAKAARQALLGRGAWTLGQLRQPWMLDLVRRRLGSDAAPSAP